MGLFREWLSKVSLGDVLLGKLPAKVWLEFENKPSEQLLNEMPRWLDPKLQGSEESQFFSQRGYVPLDALSHGPHRGKPGWWLPGQGDTGGLDRTYPQGTGVPGQGAATEPAQQQQRFWVLATTLNYDLGVPDGTEIALSRRPDGNWDYTDATGQHRGTVPERGLNQAVKSMKDDSGQVISSTSPEGLFGRAGSRQPQVEDEPANTQGESQPDDGPGDANESDHKGGRPKPLDVRLPDKFLTEYNRAVQDKFLNNPDESIMLNALAGTGKTTMLKHLSSFIKPGERWLYLVFNKKNQVEANQEFPTGVDAFTSHAYLGQVLKSAGKNAGGLTSLPEQDEKGTKLRRIVDQVVPKKNSVYNRFRWPAAKRVQAIVEKAKAHAINPNDATAIKQIMSLIEKYAIDMDLSTEKYEQDRDYTEDLIEDSMHVLAYSQPGQLPNGEGYDRRDQLLRDQDDTLWFAAMYADQIPWNKKPHYNVVLMDEVQDFNECQIKVAQKLKESGARVMAVGDPNQAMYLFRGADADAFNRLQEIVTNGRNDAMPLPVNFRSLPGIIDFAKQYTHVKNLEAAPQSFWDAKGIDPNAAHIETDLEFHDTLARMQEEYTGGNKLFKEQTAIISRTNAPLVEAAMRLMRNNIDFQIIGRDLSRELVSHINEVAKFNDGASRWANPEDIRINELGERLESYLQHVEEAWEGKVSKEPELKEIKSATETLLSVLTHLSEAEYKPANSEQSLETAQSFVNYLRDALGGVNLDLPAEISVKNGKKGDPRQISVVVGNPPPKGRTDRRKRYKVTEDDLSELPDDVRRLVEREIRDPRSYITLTTAHRSKGLEWDRVIIDDAEAFDPEKDNIRTAAEADQERNTWYVGVTRARRSLLVGGNIPSSLYAVGDEATV